jgi:hypothetical protein
VPAIFSLQVFTWKSTVNVDDYAHLYDTGYAGGWGWAWFHVTEDYNVTTGAASRRIGEHECRSVLRSLLAGLPDRLKYDVKRPAIAPDAAAAQAVVGRRLLMASRAAAPQGPPTSELTL